jgi:hypothetical protein
VEPKVLSLVRARFLWRLSYIKRVQGVLDGVHRGPVGPPGPAELSALRAYASDLLSGEALTCGTISRGKARKSGTVE